jgi:hypothetical protein
LGVALLRAAPGILQTGKPPKKPGANMQNLNPTLLILLWAASIEAYGVAVLIWACRQHIEEARHGK